MRTIVETSESHIAIMDVYSKLSQQRIVYIDGFIEDDLVNSIIAQLLYLDSVNSEPIFIYINSGGGSIYAGLALYDTIKALKSKTITVALGLCASMGFILFMAGNSRMSLKHTTFMIHELSASCGGKMTEISIAHEELIRLNKLIFNLIGKDCPTIPLTEEDFKYGDIWFDAETALTEFLILEKII